MKTILFSGILSKPVPLMYNNVLPPLDEYLYAFINWGSVEILFIANVS